MAAESMMIFRLVKRRPEDMVCDAPRMMHEHIAGVDFNILGLLTGMMVIVAITRRYGVFQYLAIWSAKRARAESCCILLMLSLITAVLSARLDNVTTVQLVAPITLLITEELEVTPYPSRFAEILASNIAGTATLIGDMQNATDRMALQGRPTSFRPHMRQLPVRVSP